MTHGPLNGERMAWLMKAQRAAAEAAEALRLMVEHDLAVRVPDSPDMNALWTIADGRLHAARETLRLGHPMPDIRETDSEAFVRLTGQIARKVADR